ncbi:hypothetical protein CCUS01_05775 [Colletotrichum cuscutae]|uniref:Uncharacterized protein n=1 Tax=Colletotrichum cuscutae TaxID=1209917 RepID=A0AAI9Y0T3_9PEZI|nr:hypothetical protein CCUS01_05775 [Colletotrichum cuscutae]
MLRLTPAAQVGLFGTRCGSWVGPRRRVAPERLPRSTS